MISFESYSANHRFVRPSSPLHNIHKLAAPPLERRKLLQPNFPSSERHGAQIDQPPLHIGSPSYGVFREGLQYSGTPLPSYKESRYQRDERRGEVTERSNPKRSVKARSQYSKYNLLHGNLPLASDLVLKSINNRKNDTSSDSDEYVRCSSRTDAFQHSITQSSPFGIHYETADDKVKEKSNSFFDDPIFRLEFEEDYIAGRKRRRELKELAAKLKKLDDGTLRYNYLNKEEIAQIQPIPLPRKKHKHDLHDRGSNSRERSVPNRKKLGKKRTLDRSSDSKFDLEAQRDYHDPTCIIPNCSRSACRLIDYNTLKQQTERTAIGECLMPLPRKKLVQSERESLLAGPRRIPYAKKRPAKSASAICLMPSEQGLQKEDLSASLLSLPIEERTPEQRFVASILMEVFEDAENVDEVDYGNLYPSASARSIRDVTISSENANPSLDSNSTVFGKALGDNYFEATLSFSENSDSDATSSVSLIFQMAEHPIESESDVENGPPNSRPDHRILPIEERKKDDCVHNSAVEKFNNVSAPRKNLVTYHRSISKGSDSTTSYFGSDIVNFDRQSRTSGKVNDLDATGYNEEEELLENPVIFSDSRESADGDSESDSFGAELQDDASSRPSFLESFENFYHDSNLSLSESCSLPSVLSSEDDLNRCFDDIEPFSGTSEDNVTCDDDSLEGSSDEQYESCNEFPSGPGYALDPNLASRYSPLGQTGSIFETDRSVGLSMRCSTLERQWEASRKFSDEESSDSVSYFSHASVKSSDSDESPESHVGLESAHQQLLCSVRVREAVNISADTSHGSNNPSNSKLYDSDSGESSAEMAANGLLFTKIANVHRIGDWESADDILSYSEFPSTQEVQAENSVCFSPKHYGACFIPQSFSSAERARQEDVEIPVEFINADVEAKESLVSAPALPTEINKANDDGHGATEYKVNESLPADEEINSSLMFSDALAKIDKKLASLDEDEGKTSYVVERKRTPPVGREAVETLDTRRNTFSDRRLEHRMRPTPEGRSLTESKRSTKPPLISTDSTKASPLKRRGSGRNSYYDNCGSDSGCSEKGERKRKPRRVSSEPKRPPKRLNKFPTTPDDYVGYEKLPDSKFQYLCKNVPHQDSSSSKDTQFNYIGFDLKQLQMNPKWTPHYIDHGKLENTPVSSESAHERKYSSRNNDKRNCREKIPALQSQANIPSVTRRPNIDRVNTKRPTLSRIRTRYSEPPSTDDTSLTLIPPSTLNKDSKQNPVENRTVVWYEENSDAPCKAVALDNAENPGDNGPDFCEDTTLKPQTRTALPRRRRRHRKSSSSGKAVESQNASRDRYISTTVVFMGLP